MTDNTNENLKSYAEDVLLKSKDEVSKDRDIIDSIKDKVIIIKENNTIEVVYGDKRPLVLIPLYLTGKFVGHKILKIFDSPCANIEELSTRLNLPVKALSRPIGILLGDIIEKTDEGYKVRAFRLLDYLQGLEPNVQNTSVPKKKKVRNSQTSVLKEKTEEESIELNPEGIKQLSDILKITEAALRSIFFFRENDLKLIDTKFTGNEKVKEIQLDVSLAHLLALKYCFNIERCDSSFLRNKLKMLGVESLVNLTTNLHKFPQYIIHEAGKKGSTTNYFLMTHPGEERIKQKIVEYISSKNGQNQ